MQIVFFIIILVLVGWIITRKIGDQGSHCFLFRLFLAAFLLRLMFALFFLKIIPLWVVNHPNLSYGFFNDDGMAYDQVAFHIVSQWWQGVFAGLSSIPIPGARGYILLNAVLYTIFGHQILAVRFFNSFLGALVPVFSYGVAIRVLSRRWARLAALLIAFYPEQILYSSVHTKGISLTFVMIAFLWGALRWQDRPTLVGVVWMSLCLVYVVLTRFYFAFPLLVGTAVVLWSTQRRRELRLRWLIPGIMSLGVLLIGSWYILSYLLGVSFNDLLSPGRLDYFILRRQNISADSFYRVFSGASGSTRLALMPLAIIYTLMNPFLLWPLLKPDPVYTLLSPSIVLWYILMPFILFALLSRLRSIEWHFLFSVLAVALFLLALSGGGAVAVGRLKVPLEPLFLIYAVEGLRRFVTGSQKLRIILFLYASVLLTIILFYLFVRNRDFFYSLIIGMTVSILFLVIHSLKKKHLSRPEGGL